MEAEVESLLFGTLVDRWRGRALKHGERYVGHINEDCRVQGARIQALLRQRLRPAVVYEDMLDLGCGWGRFEPFWSDFAGHIWAVDLLPDMAEKARLQAPNVTSLRAGWPYRLPLPDASMDLLWACFTYQDMREPLLFNLVMAEVGRILKPQARVLVLDSGKLREPKELAERLSLRPGWQSAKVTVNAKPQDTWLIDGISV